MNFYSYINIGVSEFFLLFGIGFIFLLGIQQVVGGNINSISYFWFDRLLKISLIVLFLYMFSLLCFFNYNLDLVSKFDQSFYILFFKICLVLILFFVLVLCVYFVRYELIYEMEFLLLLLISLCGMLSMLLSNDFLVLYLGMEIQSFCFYVLAGFKKGNLKSTEGSLKYFVLGSLASGFFLYGVSVLYGLTGSLVFSEIELLLSEFVLLNSSSFIFGISYVNFGLLFILIGFFFKMGIVPFHFWVPDIYEGSPALVTCFFSLVTKIVLVAVLVRFLYFYGLIFITVWQNVFMILGLLSVLIGAFGALFQTNFLRFIGYASINHAGYILIGLSLATLEGVEAALVYLVIYLILGLALFFSMLSVYRVNNNLRIMEFGEVQELVTSHPYLSGVLCLNLFSFAGIPPLLGFFGKFYIFMALAELKLYVVLIILSLAGLVSAFYYIRIIRNMYFEELSRFSFFSEIPKVIGFFIGFFVVLNIFGFFLISPIVLWMKLVVISLVMR